MKVLHCIPTIWSGSGGPSRALLEMCSAVKLVAPALSIDVATTRYGLTEEWMSTVYSRLPQDSQLYLFPQVGVHTSNLSPALFWWCWNHFKDYDVIHIHALLHPISTICAWVARRKQIPYVVRPLGTLSPYTFNHRNTWLKRLYFSLVDSRSVRGAKFIHFTADKEQEKASRLGLDTPSRVIPLPFLLSQDMDITTRSPNLILFMSRLHPVKGIELLLHAFSQVLIRYPACHLIIAGSSDPESDDYLSEIKGLIDALQIGEKLEFCGFVEGERKKQLLEMASIFVLPSHQENFGIAVVEAMDAQIPVVITAAVDISPKVEVYRAGIIIDHDIDQLADALLALLTDPEKRRGFGANGRRLVQELYAPEVVGKQLYQMYFDAVND